MFKAFLFDLAMQRGMLKKHCDRNIGPLYHAFTPMQDLNEACRPSITSGSLLIRLRFGHVDEQNYGSLLIPIPFWRGKEHAPSLQAGSSKRTTHQYMMALPNITRSGGMLCTPHSFFFTLSRALPVGTIANLPYGSSRNP
jgi:hypothetical protein